MKGCFVYRHVFIITAFVLGAALIIAGLLVKSIWSKWNKDGYYHDDLTKTELFLSREKPINLNIGNFLRALFTVFQGAPLQLLLLPSMVALLSPADTLWHFTIIAFIISYILLLMGGLNARLNQMWDLFKSAFFRGGTRWVSILIIILAITRFSGISYVSTIFDTAEGAVIAILLLNAIVLLKWYDYWVDRLLAQELIRLLDSKAGCSSKIPYDIETDAVHTSVPPENRVIQVHGSSRFIVIHESEKVSGPRFQAHGFEELFQALATGGSPGGKADPSPRQIKERIFDYKALSATVLIVLSLLICRGISNGIQQPELVVENTAQPVLTLSGLLNSHIKEYSDQPCMIIAASGGGTRAALYTASVLEGLANQNHIREVIMGSGVSGGGAALAYFAGKKPVLASSDEKEWDAYFDKMKKPFIRDVLNSAIEWRTVSNSRLGILLSESFKWRWKLQNGRNKLGEVKDFGLVLNTAIAGRFECDKDSQECLSLPLIEAEAVDRFRKNMTGTEMAGGRLILTNLLFEDDFVPSIVELGGPEGLPVIVDDPSTRLEVAAALNANFPPVFSNAAVDIGGKSRYWVTDGGAADNRGIEMMLYALREALVNLKKNAQIKKIPSVTVVTLDAGAFSNKYTQDRGVGSMAGAGKQYASLLVEELLGSIRKIYADNNQTESFRFIPLPMPICLRESGSFGTHWMLQPNINVKIGIKGSRKIKGDEMVKILRLMHSPGKKEILSDDGKDVFDYAVKDPRWHRGAKYLGFIPNKE